MIKWPALEHSIDERMMAAATMTAEPYGLASAEPALPPTTATPLRLSGKGEVRFRGMVDAYFDVIWRSLRGLGVPSASLDDAAQQVFWIAAQKLDAIELGSERPFLFQTARGIAANQHRARSRSRELHDENALAAHIDPAPSPEQVASSREARLFLAQFLDKLPDDIRCVFMLFELEGMTMAEIAEMLDAPTGTVASRLRRAREEFQSAAKRFRASLGGRT